MANEFRTFAAKFCMMSECHGACYISNGELVDCHGFDKVFLSHSTYIYEVFRVMWGIPLFLEDHLERLFQSVQLTGNSFPWTLSDLERQVMVLIETNSLKVGNLKFVFRQAGAGEKDILLLYVTEHKYPTQQQFDEGVAVVLFDGIRSNPNAKVMDVVLRQQTNEVKVSKHVYETLLVDAEGYITEGSRSNVFFIAGDAVITPPLDYVLPGITRKHIIECCRNMRLTVREERVHMSRLKEFDAAFISGTSRRVLPLNQIDNHTFDARHKLIRQIQHDFNNKITVYLLRAGL